MRSTPNGDPQIKAIARRRPSFGKTRTRTFLRGVVELSWCAGVLAGAAYLWTLPEPERGRTLGPLLQSEFQAAAFYLFVAAAPLVGIVGLYRVVVALLDLCWPRRKVDGVVVDRGTVDGGPWTPSLLGPLVGWRKPTTMRWVTIVDETTGRVRTLHVAKSDRWFDAAPGARVHVVTTGVLRHVRSVEVVTPAPPMVASAPFAGPPDLDTVRAAFPAPVGV